MDARGLRFEARSTAGPNKTGIKVVGDLTPGRFLKLALKLLSTPVEN
jgi:hypothetical protein